MDRGVLGRLVVWGGKEGLESHRWIQRAFHENALKLGIPSVWLPNRPASNDVIAPSDTVLTADVFGAHLAYQPGVNYCLHNFNNESSPLCRALEQTPERLLRLQVWTDDAIGESFGPCRKFDLESRLLQQPWGTDLLEHEFLDPVFNPDSRAVTFVGAVWSDQYQGAELGNAETIAKFASLCAARGLLFGQLTQVSEEVQVAALRAARLTPALAGAWQAEHGYLPCRSFKLPSYGCAMFTNVPAVSALFDGATLGPETSMADQLEEMLALGRDDYLELVLAQQEVAARFTYAQSLAAIERAFGEMRV